MDAVWIKRAAGHGAQEIIFLIEPPDGHAWTFEKEYPSVSAAPMSPAEYREVLLNAAAKDPRSQGRM